MSYAIRRRTTALAFVGLLVGLPLVGSPAWAAPASAGQPSAAQLGAEPEAAPGVDFGGGGLGLLLCGSRPATPRITVGAETKVKLTNKLGQGATLRIDGEDSVDVADGETVEVQFHRGPVSVAMVPECLLNLNPKFEELTVNVSARIAGQQTTPTTGAQPTTGGRSPSAKVSPSSKPDRKKQQTQPNGQTNGQTNDQTNAPDLEVPAPTEPLFQDPNGTDGSNTGSGDNLKSPATVVNPDGTPAIASVGNKLPVDKGPIGLLAIIATVCVVGVAAGAIRAIISQRATRAEFA